MLRALGPQPPGLAGTAPRLLGPGLEQRSEAVASELFSSKVTLATTKTPHPHEGVREGFETSGILVLTPALQPFPRAAPVWPGVSPLSQAPPKGGWPAAVPPAESAQDLRQNPTEERNV